MSAHRSKRTEGESHFICVCKVLSPSGWIHHVETSIPNGSILGPWGGLSQADSVAMLSNTLCDNPMSSSALLS